ncbi:FAD-dependent oxidoreductase [Streptomyces sp. Marseille-Q5077]|uniref:FAD-dependent oxidoreductase n=1 Tax=Streptomyces sp. Marseille-Q5077 TaxID=3418995 RepID=UPI003CFC4B70
MPVATRPAGPRVSALHRPSGTAAVSANARAADAAALPLPRYTERPFVGGRCFSGSHGVRSSCVVMPVATRPAGPRVSALHRPSGTAAVPANARAADAAALPLPRYTERPFVGGRCFSGSHGVRSSCLVMPVATATGRAVGVGAAPSVRHGGSPREHPWRGRPDDDAPARCPPERAA